MLIATSGGIFLLKHESPKASHILRLNSREEPKTMDPRKGGEHYSSQMHFLLFEGLVKLYPDRSIKLAQAESYEVSEDNLVYTFHLKDTIWSNNDPVTAYDFEQSWKDILDPNFPSMNAQLFSPIKNADMAKKGLVSLDDVGIKALDAKTLVITLEKPTPYLFKLLAFSVFCPVNIENDRKKPDWADDAGPYFVCNGPYLLEKWDHDNQIIVTANPNYRKTKDLHPHKILFNIVQKDEITLQMFEKGLVDIIGDCITSIPLEAIPSLEKKYTISHAPRTSSMVIAFNTDKFPFNHYKIRRAFGLAINRQELLRLCGNTKNAGDSHVSAATNMIPPVLKENRHRFFFADNDIAQAKTLLEEGMAELGITKDAFSPVVLYYHSRACITTQIMQVIQQQWFDALGILIKIECLDYKIALNKLISGDYDMSFVFWSAMYFDPMSILERFKYKTLAKNYTNWENQEYIRLLDRSFYEQADERFHTLEEAEELFLNEMPVIPLYHENYIYITNPRLPFSIPLWGDRMLLPPHKPVSH